LCLSAPALVCAAPPADMDGEARRLLARSPIFDRAPSRQERSAELLARLLPNAAKGMGAKEERRIVDELLPDRHGIWLRCRSDFALRDAVRGRLRPEVRRLLGRAHDGSDSSIDADAVIRKLVP